MFLDQKILTFIKVYEEQGITRAAEALHITQPAVSTQIKELEQELKVRLFEKRGRGLMPTQSGDLLYRRASVMKNDATKLFSEISHKSADKKDYSFGVTMTIGEYVIPAPLARLLKENSEVNANLIIGNTDTLLKGIDDGSINFALIEGSVPPDDLKIKRFATVPFICVCNKKHVFKKEIRKLTDLLDECLVCRESGSGTRNILETRLNQDNLSINSFQRKIEACGMHAILLMLKEDLGISFMYKPAADEFIEKGFLKEIRLENFSVQHDFSFVFQKNSIFADEYEDFYSLLKKFSSTDFQNFQ